MWQETKHGLFKQFNFASFDDAFSFMSKVAAIARQEDHYPRWENDWSVVQIWLLTHDGHNKISDKDYSMAKQIDSLVAVKEDKVETTEKSNFIKLFADGGSRGNPGPSASGYVLMNEKDEIIEDKGVYLGVTTNNQAEYTALKLALEDCHKRGAEEVQVFMDSLLVINQMKGIFKVKNRDLWPIHDAIKNLSHEFKKITFQHVPREYNKLADAAVNRALDDHLANNNSQK